VPASSPTSASLKLFSSHLLGTPLTLTSTLSWPLDLFLTPPALVSYSAVFAYLTALRKTHVRVLGLWLSLSGAQRTRRKWTGVGEGGEENRKKVARLGWGVVRQMVSFLDALMAHFQVSLRRDGRQAG
jgi:gamma-tubulin complex component 4